MSNSEAYALIIGLIMPFIISRFKSMDWDAKTRFWFSAILCLAAGAANAFINNQLVWNWNTAIVDVAIVFTAAKTFYDGWFKDTAIEKSLAGK
jgi:hypothetical protein